MKKLSFISLVFMVACLSACYDDLGNYDYREINTLEVEGIESLYAKDVDDSLNIVPVLKGSMYSDTSRFTYEWEINRAIVAETQELHIVVNMVPGEKRCRYIVTDKDTGVKSYASFRLNVSSSTAGDLIVVLGKYNGHAELSYLRLDKPANWAINYYEERFGEQLGINPQQLLPCYAETSQATPITCSMGRLMVLCDDQISLLDKSTMQRDTTHPYILGEDYTGNIAYPKPDVKGYKSQFMVEGIHMWRTHPYGSGFQIGTRFIEISGGAIYSANVATNGSTPTYANKVETYYQDGTLSPFGYWDDMNETPNDHLTQMGYDLGDFIVFDKTHGRFTFWEGAVHMREVPEEDTPTFPGYEMIWGSATNRPNRGSIAVLSNGSQIRLLMLEHGQNKEYPNIGTKILAGNVDGGIITPSSKFYMAKKNDNLFFTTENAVYRYDVKSIAQNSAPNTNSKIVDLAALGYGTDAVITDICVSRSEKTLLVGVSRYGNDAEGSGEELKGDLLYFDFDVSNVTAVYREDKSAKGISGIPVDVEIKYQTWWRNGLGEDGVTLRDNI